MLIDEKKLLKKAYIFIFIWSFYSLEPKFFKRVSFTNYWEVFASITILLPFLNSIYYLYLNFHLPWKYWISFLIFQMNVWFMGTIYKSFFLFKSNHQIYIFDLFHFFSVVPRWSLWWLKLTLVQSRAVAWLKTIQPWNPLEALDFLDCFGISTALYQFVFAKLIER